MTRSKLLLDHATTIDVPDKFGQTPLHIAAKYGHDLLLGQLLQAGFDPTLQVIQCILVYKFCLCQLLYCPARTRMVALLSIGARGSDTSNVVESSFWHESNWTSEIRRAGHACTCALSRGEQSYEMFSDF